VSGPEHPWQLTLAQLLDYARNYGEEPVKTIRRMAELRGDSLNEPLLEHVLRGYIARAGLPLVDFGFEEEELDEN
jgi:hypothetical protein